MSSQFSFPYPYEVVGPLIHAIQSHVMLSFDFQTMSQLSISLSETTYSSDPASERNSGLRFGLPPRLGYESPFAGKISTNKEQQPLRPENAIDDFGC